MLPATITLVHTPACHFCADARRALVEIGREVPLRIETVEADSPRGATLLAAYRPAMFPLVLVDGSFFSQGRLPRRKLCALLTARTAVTR